ncbi:hypothetical protein M441DRAFT_82594 [Trichoderma asperellum CBS 433.97]|uniref:Zn(2)-C6 fungal-type domain-containing protein n=1 Tax=Trichoderma asperellum (strain ATCC 204424 / CBS 433.97 / NBRC 101777) TaxID=1042311 RepID=A0A2T3Z0W9_TRIA4|nr:hypothetical protein M441DRAFT_82594 [Trichoderma asperellum CBS 433.97]PTB38457.1 hypothetical protein M441DRAFT_82594 [Trichoderma asperellum CBS 433.97]
MGHARRQHTKSRLGCQTCKRRKIKCDESKPQCGNCARFSVPCDFSPIPAQATSLAPKSTRRGRPRSDWASWAEQLRLSSAASAPRACTCSAKRLDVDSLELFHNFMTTTAQTLGDDIKFWSEGVPQLGVQHPCILELILALSSFHLARLKPDNAPRYLELAEKHSTFAIQEATEFLKHLDSETSAPLYVIAVLICFTALAKGPTPGHLLLVAEHGQISWLSLLRGVKFVVSTSGWPSIFSGALADYQPQPEKEKQQEEPSLSKPLVTGIEDWRLSLNGISDLIAVVGVQRARNAYEHEMEVLLGCFESTFGKGRDSRQTIKGTMQAVMSWVYQLNDVFIEQLENKDTIALIILGHFCVLLSTIERYWFIEGWARHTIQEILHISEACRRWLSWPIKYLE